MSRELKCAAMTGWGFAVPSRILTNADLEKIVNTSDEWITSHTGILERLILSEGKTNFSLALAAARQALAIGVVLPGPAALFIAPKN